MISALGQCPVHHIDLMSVGLNDFDGTPTCIKCKADAQPKTGRTQVVEDPGESFNGYVGGGKAKVEIIDSAHGAAGLKSVAKAPTLDTRFSYTAKDIVDIAVAQLRSLPMPEDVKEFKKIQKVIKTLQTLVENQNG